MFVLQTGRYSIVKMEYAYGRRAQSTIETLQWKDVAMIHTESLEDAIAEAKAAIADWKSQGYSAERWRLEGRGRQIHVCHEIG